jgi:hypothetical protein
MNMTEKNQRYARMFWRRVMKHPKGFVRHVMLWRRYDVEQ